MIPLSRSEILVLQLALETQRHDMKRKLAMARVRDDPAAVERMEKWLAATKPLQDKLNHMQVQR